LDETKGFHTRGEAMRKVVRTSDAPKPKGVYSQAIVADGFVFVAGQGCINPRTNEFEYGDIQSETRRTLQNIRAILEAAGSSLKEVVRVGVFLADLKDFAAMNEVYKEFFPEDQPARTTVGVQLPKIKIEIDCIARLKHPRKN
jgi:2-iminobutanoate/2-iminopropanoate deaminase